MVIRRRALPSGAFALLLTLALVSLSGCGGSDAVGPTTSAPSVTTSLPPDGRVGVSYSQTLAARGGDGSYSWTITSGALPVGLSLSAAGTISGTPTAAAAATFTVQVSSAGLTGTASLTITVAAPLDVSGVWTATIPGIPSSPEDGSTFFTLTLVQSGSVLTGSHSFTNTLGDAGSRPISGTLSQADGSLILTYTTYIWPCEDSTTTLTGTVTSTTVGSEMNVEQLTRCGQSARFPYTKQ